MVPSAARRPAWACVSRSPKKCTAQHREPAAAFYTHISRSREPDLKLILLAFDGHCPMISESENFTRCHCVPSFEIRINANAAPHANLHTLSNHHPDAVLEMRQRYEVEPHRTLQWSEP